jgi:iron uptake system component EfeO
MVALFCSPLMACGGSPPGSAAANKPDAAAQTAAAMQSYHDYLVTNADKLVTATKAFTDAVRAGDIASAKQQYVIAHPYHERLESVTDNFDELDSAVDQRPAAGTDPAKVTGFHRIEKALWGDNSVSNLSQLADKLDADVATLRSDIQKGKFTADQVLKGASRVLHEVGDRNSSQDEDTFSHTDLYDITGNIEGTEQVFTLLEPAISARDAALAGEIKQKFNAADAAVAKFKQGNVYPDFTSVSGPDRQAIGKTIKDVGDALARASSALT